MTVRVTRATARRVLEQLRRDRRSLALIVIVPPALLALLRYILDAERPAFQRVAVPLVGMFPLIIMFLITSITMLRERTSGTLERLLATPLTRAELVLGYLGGFALFALLQALVILAFTVFVLKVQYRGNLATIFLVEAVLVVGAVSLGLAISAFARNELQAVQFVPLVLVPQIFLSGLLVPVDQLNDVLRAISVIFPLTYANEALRSVMVKGYALTDPLILRDIGVLALFAAAMLGLVIANNLLLLFMCWELVGLASYLLIGF